MHPKQTLKQYQDLGSLLSAACDEVGTHASAGGSLVRAHQDETHRILGFTVTSKTGGDVVYQIRLADLKAMGSQHPLSQVMRTPRSRRFLAQLIQKGMSPDDILSYIGEEMVAAALREWTEYARARQEEDIRDRLELTHKICEWFPSEPDAPSSAGRVD